MTTIGFSHPVIMFGRRWDSQSDLDVYRSMVEAAGQLAEAKSTTSLAAMGRLIDRYEKRDELILDRIRRPEKAERRTNRAKNQAKSV